MKNNLHYYLLLLVFTACATPYKVIQKDDVLLDKQLNQGEVVFNYASEEQYLTKTKRYRRKTARRDWYFVPVEVKNNSGKPIVLTRDRLQLFEAGSQCTIVDSGQIEKKLRQHPFRYLAYMLPAIIVASSEFPPVRGVNVGDRVYVGTTPSRALLFGGITALNFTVAYKSNQKLKTFMEEELWGKEVPAGGALQGWICLQRKEGQESLQELYFDWKH
ncbi:hypothetical protein [Algivirga pacifica]|uniref:Lipoprotein n=1 Tax=Algivirga pacifica TaxID=1162670 RepID=A0ABP9D333_9BACT